MTIKNSDSVGLYFEENGCFITRADSVNSFELSDEEIVVNGYKLKQCCLTMDGNSEERIYGYNNEEYMYQLKEIDNEILPKSILLTNNGIGKEMNMLFPTVKRLGDSVIYNFYTYSNQANDFSKFFRETRKIN